VLVPISTHPTVYSIVSVPARYLNVTLVDAAYWLAEVWRTKYIEAESWAQRGQCFKTFHVRINSKTSNL
jgi:hypothetical protein